MVKVKLMVLACTASLNVAVAADDTATFVAPLAGDSAVTVGRRVGQGLHLGARQREIIETGHRRSSR